MTVDVRTVSEAEFPAWVAAMRAGFLGHAAEGEAEVRRVSAYLDRTWGAFDGDRVVGTLRSWPCEITVPGGAAVPVAALTNVTVSATHRRRGLLNRMMEPDLTSPRSRARRRASSSPPSTRSTAATATARPRRRSTSPWMPTRPGSASARPARSS